MCMNILPSFAGSSQEGVGALGTGVIGSHKPPCGHLEPNFGPL